MCVRVAEKSARLDFNKHQLHPRGSRPEEPEDGERNAHTCLEPPQVSCRHSEFVAPLRVAHVRGEAVVQSVSWPHKSQKQLRMWQPQEVPCS